MEPMYYDAPAHLTHQLMTWMKTFVNDNNATNTIHVREVANHMRFSYGEIPLYSKRTHDYSMASYIADRCEENAETLLQVIEFLLPRVHDSFAERLEKDLRLGNSAYAVSSDLKRVEMRVTPAVKAQVEDVISAAGGSAGDHLTNAWNEAYGRQPDPVKSYSETIKAVEAALATRVTPQNPKQTLGTMIADVRNAPQNFEFAMRDGQNSSGVQTVLAMMCQLWEGQTSRHGGTAPTRPETVEEAKAAVHLGVALVQWGVSGAFGRT